MAKSSSRKAVIFAGGKGTRLAPFTTVLPKPLVPVGDMPILEIMLRQLVHHGVTDVVIAVGHLSSLIRAYFENHPLTRLDNVTLTSHAAFMTEEASARLLRMALELLAEERAAA